MPNVYAVFKGDDFQEIARTNQVSAMRAGVVKAFDMSGKYDTIEFNYPKMWSFLEWSEGYQLKQCKLEDVQNVVGE